MDCLHCAPIPYEEFSDRMHGRSASCRIPLDCSFEITYRCNLRCAQCYCAPDRNRKELDLKEIRRILDELADAGCLWILLTGGEPLTRPDFLDIYTYAKRKGMVTSLFTNGTLLTPAIADHLAEYRPFMVEITLYGATEETYEKVTGVAGSFRRCMQGIDLLLERRLPLRLKSTVSTINLHELPEMKAFAKERGVEFRFDPVLNKRFDGTRGPEDIRISPRQIVEMDLSDPDLERDWKRFCANYWHPMRPQELFVCPAGQNSCHIDPYGMLQICLMVKNPGYDLRRGAFGEGWNNFIPGLRKMRYRREQKCHTCEALPICDKCPGWSLLEHGDMESPVDYLCDIAHMRARAFGMIGNGKERGGSHVKEEALSEA